MNIENSIEIKNTKKEDLEILYDFQLDKESNYLAAFTSKDPSDKYAYLKKYSKLLSLDSVNMKTIYLNNEIVGSISKFEIEGEAEITYWIGKKFWNKGITTYVVKQFLKIEKMRPIYGRVAFDNFGSKKVLENSGFKIIGTEKGFANARGTEIEEYIYQLE